jgi:hypothetical protein
MSGDDLVRLTSAANEVEAGMIEAMLSNNGIPCVIRHQTLFTSMLPVSSDTEILVSPADHARAAELVEAHFGLR